VAVRTAVQTKMYQVTYLLYWDTPIHTTTMSAVLQSEP